MAMNEPIHFSELERLLADDNTPDELIAPYLKPAPLRALPLAPIVTVDESKVELPASRGIIGVSVKSLNDRANRQRLAVYETKIRTGCEREWRPFERAAGEMAILGAVLVVGCPAHPAPPRLAALGLLQRSRLLEGVIPKSPVPQLR